LWDERRLRVSENRVLRGIFGSKRDEVTGSGENYIMRNLISIFTQYCEGDKPRRMRWAGHVERMGRGEVYTGIWWGNLRKRDYWRDPGVDGRIILRWIFGK
jgi:hypothetical protein